MFLSFEGLEDGYEGFSGRELGVDAFGYKPFYLKNLVIPETLSDVPYLIFPDDITLHVKSGSAAEASAKENGLKYKTY